MSFDRFKAALRGFVQRVTYRIDYLGYYPCEVLKDHGDHTVDVQPYQPRLQAAFPPMTKVPVSLRMPGTTVKIKTGASVLLFFEGGDPTHPRVAIPHMLTLELLEIRTGLGHTIILDDDRGQASGDDVYAVPKITFRDVAGNQIILDSTPGAEKIEITDMVGQSLVVDPVNSRIQAQDAAGQSVLLDALANIIKLDPGTKVVVGNGGMKVALVGTVVSTPAGPGAVTEAGASLRLEVDG